MTDNDIIKALGCCDSYFDCDGCPCQDVCGGLSDLTTNTLDLIKRLKRESNSYRNKAKGQKGELARLNKQVADLTEKLEALGDPLQDAQYKIAEQQAEVERLTKIVEEQHEGSLIAMEVYKNEAIKEFAERLKSVSHPYADTQIVFELQIDNLVKEMMGDIPKLEHNSLCETDTYSVKGDDVE